MTRVESFASPVDQPKVHMEFLLLWMDNLDDVLCALRHLAPKILGFLFATVLFAATGFALMVSPQLTLAAIALIASAVLLESSRRRRLQASNSDVRR